MANSQKIALVTGAYRGIGYEVVKQLASRGWHVFLSARRREEGEKAIRQLSAVGGTIEFVEMDVASSASANTAAKALSKKTDHLDALVNNAGVLGDANASIFQVTTEALEQTMRTNAIGPLLVTQAFFPLLKKSSSARVINVSSGAGTLTEEPDGWAPAYSISKTALNSVTRQLAHALKESNIPVNSVCPGWVRTEMGGQEAPRSVEQGADTIVWLATEAPASLTGQFLRDRKTIPW